MFLVCTAEWSAVLWEVFGSTACFEKPFSLLEPLLLSLGVSTDFLKDSGLDWFELGWPLSFFLNSRLSTPKQETSVLGGWKLPGGGGTSLYPLFFLNSGGVSSSLDVFSSKLRNSSSLG